MRINCHPSPDIDHSRFAANDGEFLEAALRYPQDVFIAGEILRVTPKWLKRSVKLGDQHSLSINLDGRYVVARITHRNKASNTLVRYLTPIVQDRLQHRFDDGSYQKKPVHDARQVGMRYKG